MRKLLKTTNDDYNEWMGVMKIKYITNVRIPTTRAQGYAIMKMCEGFSRAGMPVELFVPRRRDIDGLGNPFAYYGLKDTFPVRMIPNPDFLSRTFFLGRILYWIDIACFLVAAKYVVRAAEDDIIFTRDFITLFLFPRTKFICLELHEIPQSKFLLKYVLKKPKLFFVLNRHLKAELVKLGVPESAIHITPSGVDIAAFTQSLSKETARDRVKLPHDKKIVLYSGQFYGWKGVDTLADAALQVPEALFVFVGGTDPELSDFRKKHATTSTIISVPFTDRSTVALYLQAADVVVVPNSAMAAISSYYTSPLKLLEYMAARKPIVVSDMPSIREVVDEHSAVFAQPDDPHSFAMAIRRVLSDERLATVIAENARRAGEKYSWQARADKILSIIHHEKNSIQ